MYDHVVKIYADSVKGNGSVAWESEGSILFAQHLEIDGEGVMTEGTISLDSDGSEGFLLLALYEPTAEQQERWRKTGHTEDRPLVGPFVLRGGEIVKLRDTLALDDVSEMDETKIVLMVRSFDIVKKKSLKNWEPAEMRQALRASQEPEKT